jgi:sugar/nucleoside kinase (ribokinase family)
VTSSGGESESAPAPPQPETRIVSEAELAERAAALGQPIFWAGPVDGTELELEELQGEGVRVRYVPEGSEAGEAPPEALTVGSYLLPNPQEALETFANEPGSATRQGENGREVVVDTERPTSVYFVDPEDTVQVEVYDPSPEKAMSLALSGKVGPAE